MLKQEYWRGGTSDVDTIAMLKEVARLSGEIYVEILQGSNTTSTSASGNTHAADGVVDLWVRGKDASDNYRIGKRLEYLCRKVGGFAWYRPELRRDDGSLIWRPHVHVGRTDCPNLSAAARDQRSQYIEGYNGIPLYKRTIADTGTREFVNVRWLTNYTTVVKDTDVTQEDIDKIAARVVAVLMGHRLAVPGADDSVRKPPFQEWFLGLCMRSDVINRNIVALSDGTNAVDEATIANMVVAELADDVNTTLRDVLNGYGIPNAEAIAIAVANETAKRMVA